MSCRVRFESRSGPARSAEVAAGTTLLQAARDCGLPVAHACGEQLLCARCGMQVLEGAEGLSPETEAESRAKGRNRIPAEQRLSCRAEIRGPVAVTATYW